MSIGAQMTEMHIHDIIKHRHYFYRFPFDGVISKEKSTIQAKTSFRPC